MAPKNSTPAGFAYIWQSLWVGIIAIKTERTLIHFLSDVLIAVASLNLKVPNSDYSDNDDNSDNSDNGEKGNNSDNSDNGDNSDKKV